MNVRVRAAGLPTVLPTGAMSSYRTYNQQVYLRQQWCARGRCQNAAIPGTSNHGIGRAVDTGRRDVAWRFGHRLGVRPPTDAPWEAWHTLVHLDALPRDPYPTLRKGSLNRKAIRRAQRLLRAVNLNAPLNGRYDLRTRRAVRRFQKKHHLVVDGVLRPGVWRLLERTTR
jgi:hypothetical protein